MKIHLLKQIHRINLVFLMIIMIFVTPNVFADQYDFEPVISKSKTKDILSQTVMINREFKDICAINDKLIELGLNSNVLNQNESDIKNQVIKTNTTVKNFINIAANKFNYTAMFDGDNVTFKAKNSFNASVKRDQTNLSVNKSIESVVVIMQRWDYNVSDKYISNTLDRWAKKAGYQLIWQTTTDYEVQSSGTLFGDFRDVLNSILKSFKNSEVPLKAEWYQNNTVVISTFN